MCRSKCRDFESNEVLSLFRRALNDHTSSPDKEPLGRLELPTAPLGPGCSSSRAATVQTLGATRTRIVRVEARRPNPKASVQWREPGVEPDYLDVMSVEWYSVPLSREVSPAGIEPALCHLRRVADYPLPTGRRVPREGIEPSSRGS